jgi:hypothetical protein
MGVTITLPAAAGQEALYCLFMAFVVNLTWNGDTWRQAAEPRWTVRHLITHALNNKGASPATVQQAVDDHFSLFDERGAEIRPGQGIAYLSSYPATEVFTIRPAVL